MCQLQYCLLQIVLFSAQHISPGNTKILCTCANIESKFNVHCWTFEIERTSNIFHLEIPKSYVLANIGSKFTIHCWTFEIERTFEKHHVCWCKNLHYLQIIIRYINLHHYAVRSNMSVQIRNAVVIAMHLNLQGIYLPSDKGEGFPVPWCLAKGRSYPTMPCERGWPSTRLCPLRTDLTVHGPTPGQNRTDCTDHVYWEHELEFESI